MFGIKSAGEVEGSPPRVSLTTLDGHSLQVQFDASGARILPGGHKAGLSADCLNSLLLNASPAFVAKFNESLISHLMAASEEREQPEEWEESDARAEGEAREQPGGGVEAGTGDT